MPARNAWRNKASDECVTVADDRRDSRSSIGAAGLSSETAARPAWPGGVSGISSYTRPMSRCMWDCDSLVMLSLRFPSSKIASRLPEQMTESMPMHAGYFGGTVPCTVAKSDGQIVEAFRSHDYREIPAVLVASHGPFIRGKDAAEAMYHAVMLEYAAGLAAIAVGINPRIGSAKRALVDRHFLRKHGTGAYYGQIRTSKGLPATAPRATPRSDCGRFSWPGRGPHRLPSAAGRRPCPSRDPPRPG